MCVEHTADELSIAHESDSYYFQPVNTISLKLPDRLLERLEAASRARGTTKSSLVRECLEQSLDASPAGGKADSATVWPATWPVR